MPAVSAIRLPPLVLHPFSQPADAERLLACSRASLILNNLLPREGCSDEELRRLVLEGRYSEMRMLLHLGMDLARWIGQCVEVAVRLGDPGEGEIRLQTFADVLTGKLPEPAEAKLRSWGLLDHTRVFARALGLRAAFARMPGIEFLSEDFVLEYHGFADRLFRHFQSLGSFRKLRRDEVSFEVYTSAEYSAILERGLHSH